MKWSLRLSKISGIKIYIHWTFLILVIWILIMLINQGHDWKESLMGVLLANITRTDFLRLNPDMTLDRVYGIMSKKKISFSPVFQNEVLDNKGAYWLTKFP